MKQFKAGLIFKAGNAMRKRQYGIGVYLLIAQQFRLYFHNLSPVMVLVM
jgi:hypothetical protein